MTDAFQCRAARASEHGFLVTRGLGEFRRARIPQSIIRARGTAFLRGLLRRFDTKTAVLDTGDVLVGGAIGVEGGVVMLYAPDPMRTPEVLRALLEQIGVASPVERPVTWLVPPPWWTNTARFPVAYDPFRLLVKGDV